MLDINGAVLLSCDPRLDRGHHGDRANRPPAKNCRFLRKNPQVLGSATESW